MKTIVSTRVVDVPEGITAKVLSRQVTITGPRGELKRDFRNTQAVITSLDDGKKIKVEVWFAKRKHLACVRTICSHLENMITGVTKGYLYKLRLVYAHFPINVSVSDSKTELQVRNFLGEKEVRTINMADGVEVDHSTEKDEIIVRGNSIEAVGQSAASIQQSTTVKGKDIRKFLDGIYVSEKTHIEE